MKDPIDARHLRDNRLTLRLEAMLTAYEAGSLALVADLPAEIEAGVKDVLDAGANITLTPGPGSLVVASSGGGGGSPLMGWFV